MYRFLPCAIALSMLSGCASNQPEVSMTRAVRSV